MKHMVTSKFRLSGLFAFTCFSLLLFISSCTATANSPLIFCTATSEGTIFSALETTGDNAAPLSLGMADGSFTFSPVLSPDSEQIAYISAGKLFIMDISGENNKEVSNAEDIASALMWANDGGSLAYRSTETSPTSILLPSQNVYKIVNADGSGSGAVEAMTFFTKMDSYYSYRYTPKADLFAIDFPDSGEVAINDIRGDNPTRVATIPGGYKFVAWSPDGKQLLLMRVESHTPDPTLNMWETIFHTSKATLAVVNKDGTSLTPITAQGEATITFAPAWSPDGKQIIYGSWLLDSDGDGVADLEQGTTALIRVDRDGGNRTVVLNNGYNVTCADW